MRPWRAPARRPRPVASTDPNSTHPATTGRRRAAPLALAAFLLAAALAPARAAEEPQIPEPTGYVNDHAGLMDEAGRAKLEAFLDQVQKKTGAQFAVLTVKTTAPLTPSEYKVKVFDQWKIGKKGQDDGLLLLVAVDEKEARFETGYGLEGTLPDGLESRIFRDEMAPRFQGGDYAAGITAGMIACGARVAAEKGVTLEWNGEELRYGTRGVHLPGELIVMLIAIVVLMAFASAMSRRGGGGWWMMGPGAGGWYGGFGGFGGGGFRGGGFGGGGGSFGGFGGGGSGGGGGGGHW